MFDLAYLAFIVSIARRALLLSSLVVGNSCVLRAQTDGPPHNPPDGSTPGHTHPAMENGALVSRKPAAADRGTPSEHAERSEFFRLTG